MSHAHLRRESLPTFLAVVVATFGTIGCGGSRGSRGSSPPAPPPAAPSPSPITTPAPSPAAGTNGVFQVGAYIDDTAHGQNTGLRGTINVVPQDVPNDHLCFWVSERLDNLMWAQVGWSIYLGSSTVAFFEVWDQTTNTQLTHVETPVGAGSRQFSMFLQSGTTWAFAVDGQVFGTYDMKSSASATTFDPITAVSEEVLVNSTTGPFPFSGPVTIGSIETFVAGAWVPADLGSSYGTAWGVQGHAQDPAASQDTIVVGDGLAPLQAGTPLW